jgi:hypothetical protein
MDTKEAILKRIDRDDTSSSQSNKKMKTEKNESIEEDHDSIHDESIHSKGLLDTPKVSGIESSRRAKRLAMNRTSARIRRQRAKTLIRTLQEEVNELTKSKKSMEVENNQIKLKLSATEQELDKANAIISNYVMKKQRDNELSSGGKIALSSSTVPGMNFSLNSLLSHSKRLTNSTIDTPIGNISERCDPTAPTIRLSTDAIVQDLCHSQQQRNFNQIYDTHAALTKAREAMLLSSSSNRGLKNPISPMDLKKRLMTDDSITTQAPPLLPFGGTTITNLLDRKLLEGAAQQQLILNELFARKEQEYLLENIWKRNSRYNN